MSRVDRRDCAAAWRCYAAHLDSNENRYQLSPSFSTLIGLTGSPIYFAMALSENSFAVSFVFSTRTSHWPGNLLQTSWATSVPIPRRRYRRIIKNSATSQTLSSLETSNPLFAKTNPANLASILTRKRVAVRLSPVQRQVLVPESATNSLKSCAYNSGEISKDRSLLWRGWDNFNLNCLSWNSCHSSRGYRYQPFKSRRRRPLCLSGSPTQL